MSLTVLAWVQVLAFGAMLGAAGQVIRSVAGLKKLSEDSKDLGLTFKEAFAPSCMVVSIIIGAVAGMLGVISLNIDAAAPVSTDKVVALLGIGYAGADFIEAFMTKSGPKTPAAAAATQRHDASSSNLVQADPKAVG